MASAKSAAMPPGYRVLDRGHSNGPQRYEFGINVSGLNDQWFTAPAPAIDGPYLPGYDENDGGLDMGDSAITETVGWGGFAIGAAPESFLSWEALQKKL
ncbi:MAG: hypothetical protein CM1200mP22_04610 [Dehalococcoidia bacterium]|nr:MAG: hypothetical protein CM1200mP22_04610 [Dehalococcoidia bacterium]